MTSFSIFSRETKQGEGATADPQGPAVLSYRRPGASEPQHASTHRLGGIDSPDDGAMPRVVLQLPEVAIDEPAVSVSWLSLRGFPLASVLYWLGIALGALLAVWLIFGRGKAASSAADGAAEAPVWKLETAAGTSGLAPHEQAGAAAEMAPVLPPVAGAPASESPGAGVPDGIAPAEAPAGDFPSWEANAGRPPEARTARGGPRDGTAWDAASGPIEPSEAAPLGITTPVPQ